MTLYEKAKARTRKYRVKVAAKQETLPVISELISGTTFFTISSFTLFTANG